MSPQAPAPHPGDDREVWEHVLKPFGVEFAARARELSELLVESYRLELPDLYRDPEAVEAIRASTEASIRTIAEGIEEGSDPRPLELPPETVAYARASARQGLQIGSLLRSYRLGHAAAWDWTVQELAARSRDRDELARASEICAAWIFAYIDQAMILAEELYASERERFARSAAAVRSEMITAILEQGETDAQVAGLRLRHELERHHLGICAWLDQAPSQADSVELLEAAILEVAHVLGHQSVLVHPLGLLDAAGWISSAGAIGVVALDQTHLDGDTFPGVRLAVGEPAHGISGFRSTHVEALHARRVATLSQRPAGSVTRYGLVSLQALACGDIDQVHAFVHRELGPLAADDDTCRRLAATLRVYLDEHASRGRAAKRLGIHENTISYRIRQAEELLGRSVDEDTLNLRVALALASMARERRQDGRR